MSIAHLHETGDAVICWGDEDDPKPRAKNLTDVLRTLKVATPSLILPLRCNPRSIATRAYELEMRLTIRRMPDGWWIWRLE